MNPESDEAQKSDDMGVSRAVRDELPHVIRELMHGTRPPEPEDTDQLWARSTARQLFHDEIDQVARENPQFEVVEHSADLEGATEASLGGVDE